MNAFNKVVIIRAKTRLEQLIERFNTESQAQFYLERTGGDFQIYKEEHEQFYKVLDRVMTLTQEFDSYKVLDKRFLPSYIFSDRELVIVLGQDGLVANTAKYVLGKPIIAVNPDPNTYDGILLPFTIDRLEKELIEIRKGQMASQRITMAEARFSDGQTLMAFNDFFVGPRSHVSARYRIAHGGKEENQSSSGVLISTGAGSTGWMSSVMNMVSGISHRKDLAEPMYWNTRKLLFAVREPFRSKTSGIDLCYGEIEEGRPLEIESHMPENGIVFSDGIEADAIRFTTGMKVQIGLAKESARLIV